MSENTKVGDAFEVVCRRVLAHVNNPEGVRDILDAVKEFGIVVAKDASDAAIKVVQDVMGKP